MKVILQQDVDNLGSTGDVKEVADGFGRNFLLPRKLAVLADERNVRRLQHQQRIAAAKQAKLLAAAKETADKISKTAVSIKRQAGEGDKLFGSVTNHDIADALAAAGIEVDKKSVVLEEPIRNIGVFQVPVKVLRGVDASVKVYVIRG
ncbi:MAG: 50S ribosomal protein L9 [Deltaproteobacteria bacterium]|nr:50S ribosomal protein L9 [Deltaproteobacteria bacterium]